MPFGRRNTKKRLDHVRRQFGTGVALFVAQAARTVPELIDVNRLRWVPSELLDAAVTEHDRDAAPDYREAIRAGLEAPWRLNYGDIPDRHRNDPLLPWLGRELRRHIREYVKAERARKAGYTPTLWGQELPPRIRDPFQVYDAWLRAMTQLWDRTTTQQTLDWARQFGGDLNRVTWEQARQRSAEWHEALREAARAARTAPPGDVVFRWRDGWTLHRLRTIDLVEAEGEIAGHCVGDYAPDVIANDYAVYSLRNAEGAIEATLGLEREGRRGGDLWFVEQVYAPGNAPLDLEHEHRFLDVNDHDPTILLDAFRPHSMQAWFERAYEAQKVQELLQLTPAKLKEAVNSGELPSGIRFGFGPQGRAIRVSLARLHWGYVGKDLRDALTAHTMQRGQAPEDVVWQCAFFVGYGSARVLAQLVWGQVMLPRGWTLQLDLRSSPDVVAWRPVPIAPRSRRQASALTEPIPRAHDEEDNWWILPKAHRKAMRQALTEKAFLDWALGAARHYGHFAKDRKAEPTTYRVPPPDLPVLRFLRET